MAGIIIYQDEYILANAYLLLIRRMYYATAISYLKRT